MMERRANNRQRKQRTGITWNCFMLKMVAVITMLCSHVYQCLLKGQNQWIWLDIIGRISFPIFCFVLVEGFCHTGNRKRYLLRLALWAVISECPYDMAFAGQWIYPEGQNVLFTMLLGMMMLILVERYKDWKAYGAVVVTMTVAWICKVDYGFYGIWLILVFYRLRGMKRELLYVLAGSCVASTAIFSPIQIFSVLSLPFIGKYTGERGRSWKYFFYCFYPLHLIVLIIIRGV